MLRNAWVDVTVGSSTTGTNDIVCFKEPPKTGGVMSITDIATGSKAGSYYAGQPEARRPRRTPA